MKSNRKTHIVRSVLVLTGTSMWAYPGCTQPVPQTAPVIPSNSVQSVRRDAQGLTLKQQKGSLQLQVYSDRVVRVFYSPTDETAPNTSLTVISRPTVQGWNFSQTATEVVLKTKALQVRVNRSSGAVAFFNAQGQPILAEKSGGRQLSPNTIGTLQTLRSQQSFILAPNEAIFGLGQHQEGTMNYRGHTVHLQQRNTDVAIPFLVSSRGYGVLWDNPAITDVNVGQLEPNTLTWNSEASEGIDYYFCFGPELDDVIAGYRGLSGNAPMFAKYAWGLWQSKERYQSQQELLDVVGKYRQANIPLDGIIQDWQYWTPNPWGSHKFDSARYPDPKKMMDELHADNIHLLISVWPKFDVDSPNADALRKAGALYTQVIPYVFPAGKGQWYDPFKPTARALYWKQMSDQLFSVGVDGWWLDASEAELSGKWGEFREFQTGAGAGAQVYNAYPLMHTTAVYEGQRAQTSQKRAYILTRSAYAGQQRNAATTWSGDIVGNWDVLRNQVPAGINFTLSGIPYWNTDTGGFFGSDLSSANYRELFTRWFQFSTFCPMLRIHGTDQAKEIWRFDEKTQKILTNYDNLRYHLLPYIYSNSWQVTSRGSTMMRGLVMDFRNDAKVYNVPDQYMFGPALLVSPVTKPLQNQGTPIPADHLIDSTGTPGGLTGTYYQGQDFTTKVVERKDPGIAFNWTGGPANGIGHDNFSVRWEGSVLTNKAGTYTFNLGADDGLRLWVNGKLLAEDWANRAYLNKSASIELPANTRVPIKVEYYQNLYDARVDLTWNEPGQAQNPATRATYLPAGTTWTDFWTGQTYAGGQTIQAAAPIETMPLFVRAGSVLPYGPAIQHATEKVDPLELRIYRGANGSFTLYEDEDDNYNYEKGAYATIPIVWNEAARTLAIGARKGQFPGMLKERTFRIVWVKPGKGTGVDSSSQPDKQVRYSGQPVTIKAP